MNLSEKIGYLKGLIDGLKLDDSKDEVKVMKAMTDVLESLSSHVLDSQNEYEKISDDVESLKIDVECLEDIVYEDYDPDVFDDLYDDDLYDDDYDDAKELLYRVKCPECGHEQNVTLYQVVNESAVCPECGADYDFDLARFVDDDDDDDDDDKAPLPF